MAVTQATSLANFTSGIGTIISLDNVDYQIGIGTTNPSVALDVIGDARITGILTVGSSSLTLDGTNNVVNVGTALTLGHTQGLLFHTQNLHAAGFEVNNINASGVITATSFSGDGSNLTGIDATSLKDSEGNIKVQANSTGAVVTGVLTATSFYGDGSNLTGIDATSLKDSEGNIKVQANSTGAVVTGVLTATSLDGEGGSLTLGTPTDSSLATSGALNTLTNSTKIVDGIDDLNEVAFNIIKNTAVTDVGFTADNTAGAATLTVTLTITSSGNANQYIIDWGDGSSLQTTSDSTPTHNYTDVSGGLYTVTVIAKNSSGVGAGHSQSFTRSNFITVYTPAPVMGFSLYRNSSGGSALSGNNLYVIDGTGGSNSYNQLFLANTTANASGAGIGATYSVNWGDGTSVESIDSDTAAGGSSGARLGHTWADGTGSGTSRDTITLSILKHNTTDPSEIPKNTTALVKVYDDGIAAPNGLSSKTISNVSSTGTSPRLAHGFTDNTGGAVLSAGNNVNRITSGTATAGPITTYAYNGNSGTLTANVNGSADGSKAFTTGDDSGTYTSLIIDSESDYQLLNSGGSSTSFASSIYYPGLYKGFKARVSKAVSNLSTGLNSMQLLHSATGNTNTVEFVKDNLTSTPTTNISGASLTENTPGGYRYISGIPYYNTGSPSLTLSGITITNLVGQTYTNQSNIVEVDSGSNQEGTSSSATTNSDYTYSQIDGSTTMLNGGVPIVNVGTSSPYSIGNLTVPITSSSVRTVDRIKVRARNVNGVGGYSSDISTKIQVHKSSQSGISEIAIAISDSLGNGTYTDDGVRIFDFSAQTTHNPSYSSVTNFYTNNPYAETTDPGVAGTKEASVRIGNIKYDVTDYSSGYLPVGPNRSGDTGTQYFTFAFRRQVVASFNINITSSGIAGLWIAAPGTSIDSTSTLNGWIRSDTVYAGSGVPGGNVGNGGNGSDGCASTSGDVIASGTSLSGSYTMTLGEQNLSNATGNVCLIRIALTSGQSITSLNIT